MTSPQSSMTHRREQETAREGIAIIGMSCLFPGAPNVDTFWRNILGKVDSVTDPPPEAWDSAVYYDPTFADKDKVYCQRGGYLGSLASFDPLKHGIPPFSVGGEPDQWLALQLAYDAMADAGCLDLPEEVRKRTEIILGKGTYLNGGNAIAVEHGLVIGQTLEIIRKLNPDFSEEQIEALRDEMKRVLPPMNAETVPGLIPNIIVGRIANRMDLMGPAYTVDAACASSLIAVQHAMRDLRNGDCDVALVGGSQVWMPVPTLNVFCQLGALSRRQQIRPFDKDADGTLLGEGIGMVVLKRLSDAERDGNRIYAVIRGGGMASDGRGVSVMAPRIDGEELALRRAYESSGISPDTIDLIEAHGTATPVGDVVEIQALTRVFGERSDGLPHCAIGTVKSMISHTIPASGVAGLIKLSLSLHHKVLPPTINCDAPNPKLELEKTPFYVNTETRPWIHGGEEPRRAGINAFGFGGINAHLIVEEYAPPTPDLSVEFAGETLDHLPAWESEVFILEGSTAQEIVAQAERLVSLLDEITSSAGEPPFGMVDLAATLNGALGSVADPLRLAVIATSFDDLTQKMSRACDKLKDPKCRRIKEVAGIYYFAEPLAKRGKTALLFPGEGSQYQHMLADLCVQFPEVRARFDRSDRIFRDHPREMVLSDVLFPRPAFTDQERRESERRLMQMDMAIEAVLTANDAMHALLLGIGVTPDVIVGHSTGEYSAMAAAGVLKLETDEQVAAFSRALNRYYEGAAVSDEVPRAMMLAIGADRDRVQAIADEAGGDVFLAMDNCPHQSVLVGERAAVEKARDITQREQLIYEELSFDRAYHTTLFSPYAEHLRAVFEDVAIGEPRIPLYSCTTAAEYPIEPDAVRELVVEHWSSPVEFQQTIQALYDSGVRLFVECGARGNLSAFVEDTFRGQEFAAIPANVMRRSGITQLNHLVGQLAAHGVELNWRYLYHHRLTRPVDFATTKPAEASARKIGLSTSWPMLTISDDTIAKLRLNPAPQTSTTTHQDAHPNEQVIAESEVIPDDHELVDADPQPTLVEFVSTLTPEEASPPKVAAPINAPNVLQGYFQTMQEFLGTQEDVLRAYLRDVAGERTQAQSITDWESALDVAPKEWRYAEADNVVPVTHNGRAAAENGAQLRGSLLGVVTTSVSGIELVARRVFDRATDAYLDDHTLGHSLSGSRQHALAVMPLTMSLEILAEAAAALIPGKPVIGMRNVVAHRWLAFDEQPQTLEVTATKIGSEQGIDLVSVCVSSLDDPVHEASGSPAVEAIVELAESFRTPHQPIDRPAGAASRQAPDELYRTVMFHGPVWQGVASLDVVGSTGAEATLVVRPSHGFLRDGVEPIFEIDPITLDAAGQVIGFWTSEVLESGRIVFPFRLDRLEVFGSAPAAGANITCRAAIELGGANLTSSTIDILYPDGRLWMRLSGWQDKRFDLPQQFEPLMRPDGGGEISELWQAPVSVFGEAGAIQCRRVSALIEVDRPFWSRVWSEAVLDAEERAVFRGLRSPEPRRLEWLAARTAAKEAIRSLVRRNFDFDLALHEIGVRSDDQGAPRVDCEAFEQSTVVPIVSLTHTSGIAAAVAGIVEEFDGAAGAGIGVDIERQKQLPDGFVETAFDDAERLVLQLAGVGSSNEWALRAWCAKEAIAKAIGTGLIEGPRSLQILEIDGTNGTVVARAVGVVAAATTLEGNIFAAYTGTDGHLVFATSVCDLTGSES